MLADGCILLVQIQTFPEHFGFQKRTASEREINAIEFWAAFSSCYDRKTSHPGPVRHISFVERFNKLEIEDPTSKFTDQTLIHRVLVTIYGLHDLEYTLYSRIGG